MLQSSQKAVRTSLWLSRSTRVNESCVKLPSLVILKRKRLSTCNICWIKAKHWSSVHSSYSSSSKAWVWAASKAFWEAKMYWVDRDSCKLLKIICFCISEISPNVPIGARQAFCFSWANVMFDICRGEERRRKERMMMSICLTWFPIRVVG